MHHRVPGHSKVAVAAVVGKVGDPRGVQASIGLELTGEAGLTGALLEEGSQIGIKRGIELLRPAGLEAEDLPELRGDRVKTLLDLLELGT